MKKRVLSLLTSVAMIISFGTVVPNVNIVPQIDANAATANQLNISDEGKEFIISMEGFSSSCFWDYAQWTIGYGTKCTHTSHPSNPSVGQKGGHTITKDDAQNRFYYVLDTVYEPGVEKYTSGLNMTQSQFDALVSLCYNAGAGRIYNAPLTKYLRGEMSRDAAYSAYCSYCITAGGSVLDGLKRRRKAEADLFFKEELPDINKTHDPEGYLDSVEGGHGTVTVTGWALDRDVPNEPVQIHIYMDGKSGEGGVCVATGIIANQPSPDVASVIGVGGDHRFSATFNLDVTGQHSFYAYAINAGGGNHNPELQTNGRVTDILEKSNGIISNVRISQMTPSGYTVTVSVNDDSNIGRISVPVWTEKTGQSDTEAQDDLNPNWSGESIAKKVGINTYEFYVNTKDHNDEGGRFCNDVYAYDKSGKQIDKWCIETEHRTYADVPSEKAITAVKPTMVTHSGYKLDITVADDAKIDRIAVPVWTSKVATDKGTHEPGQDDLLTGWEGRSIAVKTAKNHFEFDISILDHNGESGEYNNDIYAYDKDGNMIDRWCIETNRRTYVNVPKDEVIEDVFIQNMSPFGYDVVVKVADESIIKTVAVPVWSMKDGQTDLEAQDDLATNWSSKCAAKKIDTNIYSYHVNASDHNNENGVYCNDVYVYGSSGSLIERWSIETSHRTYAYIPIIGDCNADGKFTVADVVMLQKWILAVPDVKLVDWKAADLCEDGVINTFDLVMMKRMLISQ